jgi:hypothetical protein
MSIAWCNGLLYFRLEKQLCSLFIVESRWRSSIFASEFYVEKSCLLDILVFDVYL